MVRAPRAHPVVDELLVRAVRHDVTDELDGKRRRGMQERQRCGFPDRDLRAMEVAWMDTSVLFI